MAYKPLLALSTALLGLVVFRLTLLDSYLAWGSDMGSYLLTRNWVVGQDQGGTIVGHFRPPLYGILLLPFTTIWGDLMGSKVLAVLLSVLPGWAMFYFARRYVRPWIASVAGLALVLIPQNAWTTALNQITHPAMALTIWAFAELIRIQRKEIALWRLLPPTFLLVGMNQTSSGILAIVCIIFLLCYREWRMVKAIGAAFGASLFWFPFYIPAIPGYSGLYVSSFMVAALPEFSSRLHLLLLAPFASLFPRQMYPWWIIALVLTIGAQFVVAEAALNSVLWRMTRYIPIFTILAGAIGADKVFSLFKYIAIKRATFALALPLVIFANVYWLGEFHRQAQHYQFVKADSLQAIAWMDTNTPQNAYVLAHPEALAIFIGGMTQRPWAGTSGRGTALKVYAPMGNALITAMGWHGVEPSPIPLVDSGIDFIVVDHSTWQSLNDGGAGWRNLDVHPWFHKQAQFGTVDIYKVGYH